MAKENEMTPQELEDAMYARVMERVENDNRIREAKRCSNGFFYGGQLSEIKLSIPSQKFRDSVDDKGVKIKVPVLDSNEQPTFWDAQYYCTLQQLGGSDKFTVSLELGKDLTEKKWYEFTGLRGTDGKKDKVMVITEI